VTAAAWLFATVAVATAAIGGFFLAPRPVPRRAGGLELPIEPELERWFPVWDAPVP
jgi:hypothetical protein